MPRQYTPRVQVTCRGCGRTFLVIPARIRAGGGTFCNRACQREHSARNAPARFWSWVQKSEPDKCWPWQGCTEPFGYGVFTFASYDTRQAHRVAWELTNGPVPDGLCVLHRCDNPPCCNPAHLFLGTRRDNNTDMEAKGRARHAGARNPSRGESHWQAKLTEASVREIRARYAAGNVTHRQLASAYHVSHETIRQLLLRNTWAHVT